MCASPDHVLTRRLLLAKHSDWRSGKLLSFFLSGRVKRWQEHDEHSMATYIDEINDSRLHCSTRVWEDQVRFLGRE
jgi:hypothetical protein